MFLGRGSARRSSHRRAWRPERLREHGGRASIGVGCSDRSAPHAGKRSQGKASHTETLATESFNARCAGEQRTCAFLTDEGLIGVRQPHSLLGRRLLKDGLALVPQQEHRPPTHETHLRLAPVLVPQRQVSAAGRVRQEGGFLPLLAIQSDPDLT